MISCMKALVVDDEMTARVWLSKLLSATERFMAIEQAESCLEAKRLLVADPPDVLFLDVDMPGLSGLDFALTEADLPPIVFVTGHEHFAVRAFEAQAVDYLLKPVESARLQQTLGCLARLKRLEAGPSDASQLAEGVRIQAPYRNEVRLIGSQDITHFTAAGGYANFQHDGFDYTLGESLQSLEKRLRFFGFVRVGRHALINRRHIVALMHIDKKVAIRLTDDAVLPVSRRSIAELKQGLGQVVLAAPHGLSLAR